MKTVMNHSQDGGLLKMISRTDPVISLSNTLLSIATPIWVNAKVALRMIGKTDPSDHFCSESEFHSLICLEVILSTVF